MYEQIDVAELERMADLAEAAPPELFSMGYFLRETECGTAGCLIGTWSKSSQTDRLRLLLDSVRGSRHEGFVLDGQSMSAGIAICQRFGLEQPIADFLFMFHWHHLGRPYVRDATILPRREAIDRLRKYVAYARRKQALWAEHEWGQAISKRDRRLRMLGQPISQQGSDKLFWMRAEARRLDKFPA